MKEEPIYVYSRRVFEQQINSLTAALTSIDRFFLAIKVGQGG